MASFPPPSRPGPGTLGRKLKLVSNHFKVELRPGQQVLQYDLEATEKPPEGAREKEVDLSMSKIEFNRKLVACLVAQHPGVFGGIFLAFDGRKNLFSPTSLPDPENVFTVQPADEKSAFELRIRLASVLGINDLLDWFRRKGAQADLPADLVNSLDIALRQNLLDRYIPVGKSLYSSANPFDIGEGANLWRGHYQSLRPTQSGATLNIDMKFTAFLAAGPLLDFAQKVLGVPIGGRPLQDRDRLKLQKALAKAMVKTTYLPPNQRKYRVVGLTHQGADRLNFEYNGANITVAQYFKNQYGPLRFPALPCVKCHPSRDIFVPLELLDVVDGQRKAGKLSGQQTTAVIRKAAMKPADRMAAIKGVGGMLAGDRFPLGFGMRISPEMLTVDGRVLLPPTVACRSGKDVRANQGVWNMKAEKYRETVKLESWALVNFAERQFNPGQVAEFLRAFVSIGTENGMVIGMTQPPVVRGNLNDIEGCLRTAATQAQKNSGKPCQIIFCPVNEFDKIYAKVKLASDVVLGIPSQCMLANKVGRANVQYIGNIQLKVNVKIGGRNFFALPSADQRAAFPLEKQPYMIIGADVSHGPALVRGDSANRKPSVAAMVGTFDREGVKYAGVLRDQPGGTEIIQDFGGMFAQLVDNFARHNKGLRPARLVVYRDGVSEGQFQQVIDSELMQLRRACMQIDPAFRPFLTFVTAQKRHNSKVFASNPKDADRSGNVPSGTVVDTTICHPKEFDFFLVSQGGLQGTSRPTHYKVLYDDNKFTPDQLQALTYRLCFTFARATRSVGLVTPAYYADLLAERGRNLLDGDDESSSETSSVASGPQAGMPTIHPSLSANMYFI